MNFDKILIISLSLLITVGCLSGKYLTSNTPQDDETTLAFKRLTNANNWSIAKIININFEAFHTQGLLKIGNIFYVSAVEIIDRTEIYGKTDNLWDFSLTRTTGKGRGWLFKFNQDGDLLAKVELTKGDVYHPGGIDFDGQFIWVPVSEYRPNSHSNIYRVDPVSMQATLSFQVDDHIGNIIHNIDRGNFHGSSWGSRRMYLWQIQLNDQGIGEIIKQTWLPNSSHYIDYQDCHYQGTNYMLCAGLQKYQTPLGKIALGGIELIDISEDEVRLVHQLPVTEYWSANNHEVGQGSPVIDADMVVTNNPFWAESIEQSSEITEATKVMRFYFMPNQGAISRLLVYEVSAPVL